LEVLSGGRTEIGYRIRRDNWGEGYATEVARAWLDYGFSFLGLNRVVAMIQPENHRSVRVAENIGMLAGALEIFPRHSGHSVFQGGQMAWRACSAIG
jgi:RimJ/RimL family protein N-acetyltransferase